MRWRDGTRGLASLVLAALLLSTAPALADDAAEPKRHEHANGLVVEILEPGTGPSTAAGQTAVVHYTGWLAEEDGSRGRKFDSSRDRFAVFTVSRVGRGNVIPGWNQGIPTHEDVPGMKVGEKRLLRVPAKLGYGERGFPPLIPANADLIFEIELLEIR